LQAFLARFPFLKDSPICANKYFTPGQEVRTGKKAVGIFMDWWQGQAETIFGDNKSDFG